MAAIYGGYGKVAITHNVNNNSNGPRMVIYTDNESIILNVPFAPVSIDYSGFENTYNETQRPDRKPILTRSGKSLRKMSMELTLVSKGVTNGHGTVVHQSVNSYITRLEELAGSDNPIIVEYEPRTKGKWRIAGLSYSSVTRDHVSNEITQATATIEFTEIATKTEMTINNTRRPKKVTVRHGDTLTRIATTYYGTSSTYIVNAIAKANNIRNVRHLPKTIRLP